MKRLQLFGALVLALMLFACCTASAQPTIAQTRLDTIVVTPGAAAGAVVKYLPRDHGAYKIKGFVIDASGANTDDTLQLQVATIKYKQSGVSLNTHDAGDTTWTPVYLESGAGTKTNLIIPQTEGVYTVVPQFGEIYRWTTGAIDSSSWKITEFRPGGF